MLKLFKLSQMLDEFGLEEESGEIMNLIPDEEDTEEKFFGSWLNNVPILHKAVVNKEEAPAGFKRLGRGSFRVVYEVEGQGLVVKLALFDGTPVKANRSEHRNQTAFQGLFPKVYMHGKGAFGRNYDWIVVDKVKVIDHENFQYFFPAIKEMFPTLIIQDLLYSMSKSSRERDYFTKIIEKYQKMKIEDVIDYCLKDPLFYRIVMASETIGFDIGDIRPGNVGVDSEGNFVIIDTLYRSDM